MNNIKLLKKDINVKKVIKQLEKYSSDWYIQRKGTDTLLERGYADIEVGNLQLIMGAIKKKEDFVGNSELSRPTPAYQRHTEVLKIIRREIPNREIHRCGFLSLPVDGYFVAHIDEGTYYKTRDRYHLSIAGQYQYFVGNETAIVDAGTLFWVNNKMPHGAVNLGEETRITFVFDMPHEFH